ITFTRAVVRLEQFQGVDYIRKEQQHIAFRYQSILPENFQLIENAKTPNLVGEWLWSRGFPTSICQEYELGYVEWGEYQLRLIVPIYLDGEVVSFQSVDLTGQADVKYKGCPNDRSHIPLKHTLYGIDDVGDQVIIVEGITDKWRMGKNAVALFGKKWTPEQIDLLIRKAKDKTIKICLDGDAEQEAYNLYAKIQGVCRDVMIILLEYGEDPDGLRPDIIRKIIEA
ncbi:hypothetical protein LCGC14_2967990, partial [marine sediment metagenome]